MGPSNFEFGDLGIGGFFIAEAESRVKLDLGVYNYCWTAPINGCLKNV